MKWIELFNVIFRRIKVTEEWRWSTMIPVYKTRVIFRILITIGAFSYYATL